MEQKTYQQWCDAIRRGPQLSYVFGENRCAYFLVRTPVGKLFLGNTYDDAVGALERFGRELAEQATREGVSVIA